MARSRTLLAILLPPLAVLGLALGRAGAQGVPPLVESIDVEVVNVDVEVTDRDGNPVTGLIPADFEVYEDGEVRPVTNFYAFARVADPFVGREEQIVVEREQAVGTAGEPDQQRRIAILFDTNTLTKRHRDEAVEAISSYVRERYDESHEWAVIAYSDHPQYIQRFTSDRAVVLAALERVARIPVAVSARIDTPMQTADPVMAEDVASRRSRGQSGAQVAGLQQAEIRSLVMENLRLLDRTTKAMVETMAAHADLGGRKSLILVTGVMRTLPTMNYVLGHAFEGAGAGADRADPLLLTLNTDVQSRFQGIVRTANATRFSIYPISALAPILSDAPHHDAGRRDSGMLSADASVTVPGSIDVESGPKSLAADTGGAYYSTERVEEALYDIDQRGAASYVLGFTTDHSAEGAYHRIRVKLQRPGLVARAREGYLHLTDEDRLVQALSTPLTFPKAQGEIPVDLEVAHNEGGAGKKQPVTVSGTIPFRDITLVPRGEAMAGRVQLYLAIYDEAGALVDLVRTHQDVEIDNARLGRVSESQPARFGVRVELARGTYTMSLTLRDEVTERFGTGVERVVL